MNLDVKLGGLGPDYEAIKEKVSSIASLNSNRGINGRLQWKKCFIDGSLRCVVNHTLFFFCQKEKLKQQKEYAKQIKEHNMKNIALVQRLPTKPQVISLVSRQKVRLEFVSNVCRE